MEKPSTIGATQLTIAQLIIGFNFVVVKSLLPYLSIIVLLFLRFAIATLLILALNYRHNHQLLHARNGNRLTTTDHMYLFAQAISAGFLFNLFIMIGMQYTTAATAGLITSIIPAAIAGLSVIFLKEKMNISRALSIFLAVIGLIILNLHGASFNVNDAQNLFGQFIILLSVIPEALFTILAKLHRTDLSILNKVLYMNLYNLILFVPLFLWSILSHGFPNLNTFDWFKIVVYSLSTVLFFLFWYKGLEKTSAMISGIYTALAPCSTIILAYLFLGESIHLSYVITFIIICFSIVIGSGLLNRKTFISFF